MTATDNNSLRNYFEANGFEVIDMRNKGGCLWVVGDQNVLGPYLAQVSEKYMVTGKFAQGKATRYRTGWYTKSER